MGIRDQIYANTSYEPNVNGSGGSGGDYVSVKDYKYSEDTFLMELSTHIKGTYKGHYSGGIQTVEYVMSNASTLDYLSGNVLKYVLRYGKKGGYNKEDLYKAVHFLMMMAHYAAEKFDTKSDKGPESNLNKLS